MPPALETDQLKKQYRMGDTTVTALDGVTMSIEAGEFVALLGTSGSGKSTLLNLIAGLDHATDGSLRVFGQELARLSRTDLSTHRRSRVGIIFQSFNLISTMTAAENVALAMMFAGVGRAERESRASALLSSVGLGGRQTHRPKELSGGEQQRVAIARALANAPDVLLADEPTGNLDSKTSAEIMRLLQELNTRDGKTVIMVTHDATSGRPLRRPHDHAARRQDHLGHTSRSAGMTAGDTVQLALRNLRQARLRTALTLGGVAIGIASLTGMVSLGVGLQDQFVGRFMQSGLFDQVTVLPGGGGQFNPLAGGRGGRGGGFGGRGRGGFTAGVNVNTPESATMTLDDATIAAIAALPEVKEVYPALRVPLQAGYADLAQTTVASGVPPSAKNEGAFQTMAFGAFFTSDTNASCMLSLDAANYFSKDQPASLIGKDITLTYATAVTTGADANGKVEDLGGGLQIERVTKPCTVSGILERAGGAGLGGGGVADVMLPLALAREIDAQIVTGPQSLLSQAPRKRSYTSLVVKTTKASATEDVEDKIKGLGYSVFSFNDALQGAKRAFIILDIVLSLIGSIALAVSSLGITNTMVMSILERTREIGVMKAIGASDADIRRIFLVEASAIGVLGGGLGVVLGWLVGRAVNFGANVYIVRQGGAAGNLFSLPLWLIASAIGFSWLVSLLAGSYPASRAARLNPIQALRHD